MRKQSSELSRPPRLSYVMCTKNRGDIFSGSLRRVLEEKRPCDEVVVVNGGDDGETHELLERERARGRVDVVIHGADRNQAHGWNRGFLACSGEIIKKLTDDDVYDFSLIRRSADELAAADDADLLFSNELFSDADLYPRCNTHDFRGGYDQWGSGCTPCFFFPDPPLLIRRTSLPLLGLFSLRYQLIDYEWSLRVTTLRARIIFCTGCHSLSFWRPETVTGRISETQTHREYVELDRLFQHSRSSHKPWRRRLSGVRRLLSNARRSFEQPRPVPMTRPPRSIL